MEPDDLELARRLGAGASTAELAAERNVTDRTIRNHRAALVRQLQAVAAAASAADAEALAA
jgi:DNA-binding NarL/FixJ family response regulator